MLLEVGVRAHHALGPQQHPRQKRQVAQPHLPRPVAPRLAAAQIQDRAPPGLAVQLEEPLRRRDAAPTAGGACRTATTRTARMRGRISSKYAVPGSGVRIVKPARPSSCCSTKPHSRSKSDFVPVRIDHEVAGDAVAEARARRRRRRRCDRRSCPSPGRSSPSSVAASRPKKMSKSCAIGRHASSSSGCAATRSVRLWTSSQRFRMPRRCSACGELEAARRLIPEQIVGDEHVRAGRREVVADALDRAQPDGAVVHRPDRTERAAERAAARRLDQPHRAGTAGRRTGAARRRRRGAAAAAPRRARTCGPAPPCSSNSPSRPRSSRPGTSRRTAPLAPARPPAPARPARRRRRRSASTLAVKNGDGIRRRRVAADEDERTRGWRGARAAASASTSSVSSACMQAMPTSAGRVARR